MTLFGNLLGDAPTRSANALTSLISRVKKNVQAFKARRVDCTASVRDPGTSRRFQDPRESVNRRLRVRGGIDDGEDASVPQ